MICVDASVAAKWILLQEYTEQALTLIDEATSSGQRVVSPPLLPVEVTNTIRQRVRRQALRLDEAVTLLDRFLTFPVSLMQPANLHQRALVLATRYDLPAVYDAQYVALAEMLGVTLWTNDQRLLQTLHGRLPFVRWIADYTG